MPPFLKVPAVILNKLLNEPVTLQKISFTQQDATYASTSEVVTSYTIHGEIQPLTMADLSLLGPGPYLVGDARGFFQPFYLLDGREITVEPGDRVIDSDATIVYLVYKVMHHRVQGRVHHIEAYLRRKV